MPQRLEINAFRACDHKVKILTFHPTKTWLAYADKGVGYGVIDWDTQQREWYRTALAATQQECEALSDATNLEDDMFQTVYEGVAGQGEDQQHIDFALQRLAEKSPGFYGKKGADTPAHKQTAFGGIKGLLFLDLESCFWQLHRFQGPQNGSCQATTMQLLGKAQSLRAHTWLILVCESKVRLQDLRSSAVHDIPRVVFDHKTPVCAAVLYLNSRKLVAGESEKAEQTSGSRIQPLLAVGTSAGTIYLVSPQTNYVYAKLVGGHKAGVSKIQAIPGRNSLNPEEGLLSAGSDGSLAVWYPSPQADKLALLASQELGPSATGKPHEGEIFSLTVVKSQTLGPENAPLYAVTSVKTSGEDKRVVVSQLPDLSHQVARWKPLIKGTVDSLGSCPLAGPSETPLLAISGERAAVWSFGYDGRQSDANMLINLDNYLPLGTKKAAKCYVLACHPLQSKVLAVGSNTGIALLAFQRTTNVPAAAIPPKVFSVDGAGALDGISGGPASLEYVFVSDSDVWRMTYRAERDLSTPDVTLKAICTNRLKLAPSLSRGPADVTVSANGRHIGVVWTETRDFAIYTQYSSDGWNQSQQGVGSSIAWASTGSQYAVLCHPQVRLPEPRRAKSKKSKAKDDERDHQAALDAAKMAVQEGSYVALYTISEAGIPSEIKRVDSRGEAPTALFGGPALSIVRSRSAGGSRRASSLKMLSWGSGAAFGSDLSAPNWISWEPEVTAFALGYNDAVVIFKTQPQVAPVTSLSIKGSVDGHWHRKFLVIASPQEIHAAFVSTESGSQAAFVQSMKLASIDSGVTAQLLGHAASSAASYPAEGVWCGGPSRIAGIQEGILWLVSSLGTPFMIALNDSLLRAKITAAQGDSKTSVTIAEQGIESALSLSGLQLHTEMVLSRRSGKFRRALRCLQALASGLQDGSAFREFPTWLNHQSETAPLEVIKAQGDTLPPFSFQQFIQHARNRSMEAPKEEAPKASSKRLSLLKFIAADNIEEESSDDEELEPATETLVGLDVAPNRAIDWDEPLGVKVSDLEEPQGAQQLRLGAQEQSNAAESNQIQPSSSSNAEAQAADVDQEQSGSNGEDTDASLEEQDRIAGLVTEGILLVDAALGHGHEDVAVATLRTLLQGARNMPAETLQAILVRCAQCNMTEDIKGFALRIVSEGTGAGPGPSAVAAALVDNPSLSHNVLQSSGLVALATIYSHTWKTGNSLAEISDWGKYLTAASGNGVQFVVSPPSF